MFPDTLKCSENLILEADKLNIKSNEFTKTDHQLWHCCEFWLVVLKTGNLLGLCLYQHMKWSKKQLADLQTSGMTWLILQFLNSLPLPYAPDKTQGSLLYATDWEHSVEWIESIWVLPGRVWAGTPLNHAKGWLNLNMPVCATFHPMA